MTVKEIRIEKTSKRAKGLYLLSFFSLIGAIVIATQVRTEEIVNVVGAGILIFVVGIVLGKAINWWDNG